MKLILIETVLVKKFHRRLSLIALQWKQPKSAQSQMTGPPSDFFQVSGKVNWLLFRVLLFRAISVALLVRPNPISLPS